MNKTTMTTLDLTETEISIGLSVLNKDTSTYTLNRLISSIEKYKANLKECKLTAELAYSDGTIYVINFNRKQKGNYTSFKHLKYTIDYKKSDGQLQKISRRNRIKEILSCLQYLEDTNCTIINMEIIHPDLTYAFTF